MTIERQNMNICVTFSARTATAYASLCVCVLDIVAVVCIIHTVDRREVLRLLRRDGWLLRNARGSHHQFTHPDKPGRVTVKHP